MEFRRFPVAGPIEVIPRKIEDDRGYFSETYKAKDFEAEAGKIEFVQENQSLSLNAGTIRGIHFQSPPRAQGKLVRCLAGRLTDFVIDLRHGSPTFGEWLSVILSPEPNNQLWIPVGFGHAFCTLEPGTVISYKVTDYYSPDHDKGVAWDDPQLAIEWPDIADPSTLSPKDRNQPRLSALPRYFCMDQM